MAGRGRPGLSTEHGRAPLTFLHEDCSAGVAALEPCESVVAVGHVVAPLQRGYIKLLDCRGERVCRSSGMASRSTRKRKRFRYSEGPWRRKDTLRCLTLLCACGCFSGRGHSCPRYSFRDRNTGRWLGGQECPRSVEPGSSRGVLHNIASVWCRDGGQALLPAIHRGKRAGVPALRQRPTGRPLLFRPFRCVWHVTTSFPGLESINRPSWVGPWAPELAWHRSTTSRSFPPCRAARASASRQRCERRGRIVFSAGRRQGIPIAPSI
jgi:hypothetical protein